MPSSRVTRIHSDFAEDTACNAQIDCIENDKADLVISDMAPNMSGMAAVDQPKARGSIRSLMKPKPGSNGWRLENQSLIGMDGLK